MPFFSWLETYFVNIVVVALELGAAVAAIGFGINRAAVIKPHEMQTSANDDDNTHTFGEQ